MQKVCCYVFFLPKYSFKYPDFKRLLQSSMKMANESLATPAITFGCMIAFLNSNFCVKALEGLWHVFPLYAASALPGGKGLLSLVIFYSVLTFSLFLRLVLCKLYHSTFVFSKSYSFLLYSGTFLPSDLPALQFFARLLFIHSNISSIMFLFDILLYHIRLSCFMLFVSLAYLMISSPTFFSCFFNSLRIGVVTTIS